MQVKCTLMYTYAYTCIRTYICAYILAVERSGKFMDGVGICSGRERERERESVGGVFYSMQGDAEAEAPVEKAHFIKGKFYH